MLQLRIDDPTSERTFVSDRAEVLIGRRQDVDLVVQDAAASRTHCMLRMDGAELTVIDLGTVNGTKIDGQRIDGQAVLKPGQAFSIGKTTFRIAACGGVSVTLPLRVRLEGDPRPAIAIKTPVPTGGPQADFGREIRRLLRSTPWYTISLIAHVLGLLFMSLIPFETETTEEKRLLAAIKPRQEEELESVVDPIPDEETLRGYDVEDELVAPDDEEPLAKTDKLTEIDEDPFTVPVISPSPGTRIRRLDNPLPRKSKKLEVADKTVNTNNLDREHDAAAKAVIRGLGGRRLPTGISSKRIIVVKGEFDEIETVLTRYGIPYTLIDKKAFVRRRFPEAKIVCINCGRDPGRLDAKKLVTRIKSFILRGGWLMTSDWAVRPYLTDAFPHRIKEWGRTRFSQRDTTVEVEPARSSPLLQGAFDRARVSKWWLEDTSRFFKVVPGQAEVLVKSSAMKTRFGPEDVVVTFREGRGRVLHLLGHFYQKDGNRLGMAGMHRLVLNYVLERFPTAGRDD